ncbi:MAG: hypothetical protein U0R49_04800 [Fimbriimonadales bacterium]
MSVFDRMLRFRRRRQRGFWNWFQQSAHRYELGPSRPLTKELEADLTRNLLRVHPDITWELGERELTISADGRRALFPVVEELVRAAPVIEGWRVCAFRQPSSVTGIQMKDRKLEADSIRFVLRSETPPYSVTFYIDALNGDTREELIGIAFILFDSLFGEYDVVTKLGHIEFEPLVAAPSGHKALTELAELLNQAAPKSVRTQDFE